MLEVSRSVSAAQCHSARRRKRKADDLDAVDVIDHWELIGENEDDIYRNFRNVGV